MLAMSAEAYEAVDWSQPKATELAGDLAEAADALWDRARLEKGGQERTPASAENYLLVEDLKMLKRTTRVLADRLQKAQGRAETAPLFQRILLLVNEAATVKRRSTLLTGAGAEIDRARHTLDQLSAYYGESTPPVAAPPSEE